ncbi:redoxin domain-containing protein [Spongorhabdus nitratireducens]
MSQKTLSWPLKLPVYVLALSLSAVLSLTSEDVKAGILPGQKAPAFTADIFNPESEKVENDVASDLYLGKQRVILFSYPKNCTYVCPTELIALKKVMPKLRQMGFQVLVISADEASEKEDAKHSHESWWKSSDDQKVNKEGPLGLGKPEYIMVSDPDKKILQQYGLLGDDGMALRGTVYIGENGVIRIIEINSNDIGRDVSTHILNNAAKVEQLDERGKADAEKVLPAGWKPGDPMMPMTDEGVREHMKDKS